uniref:Uncharacterized protein n=1 Tax=Nelumbo nucifera TaxID=4432 RepID=A0A822YSL5_NELNU|nr:TPA_asm: hypothetical protein HUJ06_004705 [Nelumbo nucifera]
MTEVVTLVVGCGTGKQIWKHLEDYLLQKETCFSRTNSEHFKKAPCRLRNTQAPYPPLDQRVSKGIKSRADEAIGRKKNLASP